LFQIEKCCRRGHLRAGGLDLAVHISNVSEGGAMIDGSFEMTPGTAGTLTIDGFAPALPFRVRDAHAGTLHVKFELDEPQAAAFRDYFLKLTAGLRPIELAA
jgi:methyl-accepting chemotaxis protein